MQDKMIVGENRFKQKIMLNPHDLVGRGILSHGLYDKTGLYFIEKLLAALNSPVTFDIGANIGNHALRMSPYSKMVYLFEPQADIAALLQTTMNLNDIKNWTVFNFGLSDEDKQLTLYKNLDGNNGETSFVPDLKGRQFSTEEAFVYVGDDIVRQHHIDRVDFIKIDVEGLEAKVIVGLNGTIAQHRPIIFMEWDKEITKQQFKEYNLFDTVFQDYLIKAITRNPKKSSFYQRAGHFIQRIFNKNIEKQRKVIGEFIKESNYRHVILIPREKAHILHAL